MKKTIALILIILPLCLQAGIYKCKDENGRAIFSQRPCSVNAEEMYKKPKPPILPKNKARRTSGNTDATSKAHAEEADLLQANRFLEKLPSECSGSYKTVNYDGAVNIYLKCDGQGKTINGLIAIKNGVVTKIR